MSRAAFLLAEARQALAWNLYRAKLPAPARNAAIKAELELGAICRRHRQWLIACQMLPRWGYEL